MNFKIEVSNFEKDVKGFRLARFKVKITYEDETTQTFRNVALFNKEDSKWVSFPKAKEGERWVDSYEQTPPLNKDIFPAILEILEKDHL